MSNVGRISGVAHTGAAAIGRRRLASGPAGTPTPGISDNDKGAATIHANARTQRADIRLEIGGADPAATSAQTMRDFVQAIRKRIAELRSQLEQIGSSDGLRSGRRDEGMQLKASTEFGLDQIGAVEQLVAQTNTDSELGVFSLARIRQKAMKALRCQDIEPDRVLLLLR